MLRSSKEGRKQAARYHAFPSAKTLPRFSSASVKRYDPPKSAPANFAYQQQHVRPSQQPTTIDLNSPLQRLPDAEDDNTEESEEILRSVDRQSQQVSTERAYDLQLNIASPHDAHKLQDRHEQHSKMRLDTISPPSRSPLPKDAAVDTTESSYLIPNTGLEASSDMSHDYHGAEGYKEKTPSRGTTEDNSHSSALSSPPTSQPDVESVEDENDSSLIEVQKLLEQRGNDQRLSSSDSILVSDSLDSAYNDSARAFHDTDEEGKSGSRSRHYRFKPRDVQGISLLASRSPRSKVKSLKQVEAEESLSPSSSGSAKDIRRIRRNIAADTGESDDDIESVSLKRTAYKGKAKESNNIATTVVKRKRGRPLGSTKQKRLERLQREAKESGELAQTKSREESTSANDDIDNEDTTDVKRRSRRLTEPRCKSQIASSRRGRASVPDLSSRQHTNAAIRDLKSIDAESNDDATETNDALAKNTRQGSSNRPLWKRKMFLTAGLYSDDFKHEENVKASAKRSSREIAGNAAQATSRGRKGKFALPLPADYGYWMLVEKKDFRLPYPIAQKVSELREKMESRRKPPPYKHISQNRYFSRSKLPGEILICQCAPTGNCGDSCVNRQTEYLCHPKHCPCGDRCTNIYFGKRKAVKTEVQWYGARGFGLKTLEAIPKGGFIDEYRGEVIEFNEAVRRVRDHYKETGNYYFLMYDAPAGEMLDGGLKGNITRFANHSCDPNCKVQKWLICGTDEARSGEFQVALFAERDIEAGEELTYDYGWSAFAAKAVSGESNAAAPEECHCGAANCSGFLGVKKATVAAGTVMAKNLLKRAKKRRRAKPNTADKAEKDSIDGNQDHSRIGKDRMGSSSSRIEQEMQLADVASTSKSPMLLKEHFASAVAAATSKALHTPTKKEQELRPFGSRQGLMDRMLGGGTMSSLIDSPSSLTSVSEADRFDREASFDDDSVHHLAEKIIQSTPTQSRGRTPGKRKRLSSISTEETIDEAHRLDSLTPNSSTMDDTFHNGGQDVNVPSRDRIESISTILEQVPKKKKLKVKDRVIKILVPRDEPEEEKSLIVEGKRARRLTEKATEQETLSRQTSIKKRERGNRQGPRSHDRRLSEGSIIGIDGSLRGNKAHQYNDENSQTSLSSSEPKQRAELVTKDPYHGLRDLNGNPFDIHEYEQGTVFYNRKGEIFDFEQYRKSGIFKAGTKPFLFTKDQYADYMAKVESKLEKYR